MLKTSNVRALVLIFLVLSAWGILQYQPESVEIKRNKTLQNMLSDIPGWQEKNQVDVDEKIVQVLFLDQYVNQIYSKNGQNVSLYIGYYETAQKVGAAHDPTVCFPGQGWILSDKSTGNLTLDQDGIKPISYSKMIASQGQQKHLILYWFQAFDSANAGTMAQKLRTISNRLQGKGEDNAFVRFMIPLEGRSLLECENIILDFAKAFYPQFIKYIKGDI